MAYGSLGHLGQRWCLQPAHSVDLPGNSILHLWHVLRTRCNGTLRIISWPPLDIIVGTGLVRRSMARYFGSLSTMMVAMALSLRSFGLSGFLGHFLQRVCEQLAQILSAPNALLQRWHVRWTRTRTCFSTHSWLLVPFAEVHSPGSSARLYFAKRALAFSSCSLKCAAALVGVLLMTSTFGLGVLPGAGVAGGSFGLEAIGVGVGAEIVGAPAGAEVAGAALEEATSCIGEAGVSRAPPRSDPTTEPRFDFGFNALLALRTNFEKP